METATGMNSNLTIDTAGRDCSMLTISSSQFLQCVSSSSGTRMTGAGSCGKLALARWQRGFCSQTGNVGD